MAEDIGSSTLPVFHSITFISPSLPQDIYRISDGDDGDAVARFHSFSPLALLTLEVHSQDLRQARMKYVLSHPLFSRWGVVWIDSVDKLCEQGTSFLFFSRGDTVFSPHDFASHAYLVTAGDLAYNIKEQRSARRSAIGLQTKRVSRDQWICEAALWTLWSHIGKLVARSPSCTLFTISPHGIEAIVQKHQAIHSMTATCGVSYRLRILAAGPPQSGWPDDLRVPDTDSSDLRGVEIGLGLIRRALRAGHLALTHEYQTELEKEVSDGSCAISMDPGGALRRVVAVVAVKVERDDGCILAEIGK
jgi:hypothetical protein